jgi:hypothetical protein
VTTSKDGNRTRNQQNYNQQRWQPHPQSANHDHNQAHPQSAKKEQLPEPPGAAQKQSKSNIQGACYLQQEVAKMTKEKPQRKYRTYLDGKS